MNHLPNHGCRFGITIALVLAVNVVSVCLKAGDTADRPTPASAKQPTVPAKPPAVAASVPVDTSVTFSLQPRQKIMGSLVRSYRPMRVALTDKPAEPLKAEPKYISKKPLYGAMELGVGPGNRIAVVVDEQAGEKPRIYIDRNNDKDLTNDGPGEWPRTSESSLGLENVVIDVPYDGKTIPYTFEFYRFRTRLTEFVLYYRNACRVGEITSGGKSYQVAVLDDNADGRFDDLKNGEWIIDLNQDGKLDGASDSAEFYQLTEPVNIHGKVWEVASLSPDGTKLTLRPSDAKVQMKPYLDPGCPALPFAGTDLDGKTVELKSEAAKAKYVLLDFWASWCGPCRAEFPTMRRLHAQYKNHGLQIIGISLDSDRERAAQVAKESLLGYSQIFDGLGWRNAVAAIYRVHGIPQTYLLDKDLKIVAKNLRGERLSSQLQTLLGPGDEAAAAAVERQIAAIAALSVAQTPSPSPITPDPKARINDRLAIYLACGEVSGPGKVVQVDGRGKILASVTTPNTAYGIAFSRESLVLALPRGKKLVRIDGDGRLETVYEGNDLRHPLAAAANVKSGDIFVADNDADILALIPTARPAQPQVLQRITGAETHLQNMSLAFASDGHILFGTNAPRGVYRLDVTLHTLPAKPLLDEDAAVAADPRSSRWAAATRSGLHIYQGESKEIMVSYPPGKTPYRLGALAFGPDGCLVMALQSSAGVELNQVDLKDKAFRLLFAWCGERLVTMAVGPKSHWPTP